MENKLKCMSALVAIVWAISGCDWVDSTGTQSDAAILLEEGNVVALVEQTEFVLDPNTALQNDGAVQNLVWDNEPLEQGNLPGCAAVTNFAVEVAANSLTEACVDVTDCQIYFEPQRSTDGNSARTVFKLTPPVLKAPVGLTYQLVAQEADGIATQANFTFCLIAENEEPVANNDRYRAIQNTTLSVSGESAGLLSNDTDDTDTDVRNLPLYVLTTPERPPTLADEFELFADGGFNYTPSSSVTLPSGGSRTDTFDYQISDGTYMATGTAVIEIVPFDSVDGVPVLLQPIPASQAIVGIRQTLSLADYFSDPEGSDLSYSITPGSLPPSGNFAVSTGGVLTGTATRDDIGDWLVMVTATDIVGQQVDASFSLTVVDNLSPTAVAIPAQTAELTDLFVFDTSGFFSDPENQTLVYSLAGAEDDNIEIDSVSGEISGFFSNTGTTTLSVSVSDGVNQPVSQSFSVSVTPGSNRAPVYSGRIANQTVEVRESIAPIRPTFVDPDGDELTFSILGALPPGIALSEETGVIQGAPIRAGIYADRRIVATDPDGLSARSDPFTLTVLELAPAPNLAPEYEGQIGDQEITLGESIVPIEGVFSDPDGDALSYSIVGTLPSGLSLSASGVITGEPTEIGQSPNLRIRATDPGDLFVDSDGFRITVTAVPQINRAPVFSGSIAGLQILEENEDMSPISGQFSDPDGDVLVYSVTGTLPTGIAINQVTGEISGTPTERGRFRGIRIVATDPDGLEATSNAFVIRVDREDD